MAATSDSKYWELPPPRRIGFTNFFHVNFYTHINFLGYIIFHLRQNSKIRNFSFYLRLSLFTWEIMCKIFSSNSGNITDSRVELGPMITNMVVPIRGDLHVRSCAVPNAPVQNESAKYTSKIFIFQTWINCISKDSPQRALSKSKQHQSVKM